MKNLESSIRGLINEETITEGGHHDVISAKNQIKIARDALDKMERGLSGLDDEGSLPSWWTNKVAIAIDKLDGMADYLSTQIDEEAISEATRHTVHVETDRAGYRKLERMIASLDSYQESEFKKEGKATFTFDSNKHDGTERKKVAEFIKKVRGVKFSHAIDEEAISKK